MQVRCAITLAARFRSRTRWPSASPTGIRVRSLEERYGNHDGYVAAVTAAADRAFAQGYLLAADRDALIAAAMASSVLN